MLRCSSTHRVVTQMGTFMWVREQCSSSYEDGCMAGSPSHRLTHPTIDTPHMQCYACTWRFRSLEPASASVVGPPHNMWQWKGSAGELLPICLQQSTWAAGSRKVKCNIHSMGAEDWSLMQLEVKVFSWVARKHFWDLPTCQEIAWHEISFCNRKKCSG